MTIRATGVPRAVDQPPAPSTRARAAVTALPASISSQRDRAASRAIAARAIDAAEPTSTSAPPAMSSVLAARRERSRARPPLIIDVSVERPPVWADAAAARRRAP